MHIWESIRIALDMLRLHKLRAFLTMLGVIIGVMSVTIIVMVSNGFQFYMKNEFEKLGADTIILFYDYSSAPRGGTIGGIEYLTEGDITFIKERVREVDIVSGIRSLPGGQIRAGEETLDNPRVMATDELQMELSRIELLSGRPFRKNDLDSAANVALIGEDVATTLFDSPGEAVGEIVQFDSIALEVIGVMKKIDMMGESTGRDVWVPITTSQRKWVGGERIDYIAFRPKDGVTTAETMDAVWKAMMIRSNNRPIYRMDSRESILAIIGGVLGGAGVILASIAALSLLVGGIGIMNIMLVSVTERTREIGLRKAVGGTRPAIMTQFLVESSVLSMVGGIIGMSIAYTLGLIVQGVTTHFAFPSEGGLPTPFPMSAAIMAALFSAFIGAVFGLYPAARAASLSPIEALRTE